MTTRVTNSLLPVPQNNSNKKNGSKKGKGKEAVEAVQPTGSVTPPAIPWATSAGVSLYQKVQDLPESGVPGSPEKTSPDSEEAKRQGIGRDIDTFA